jgi:hypothetical protein
LDNLNNLVDAVVDFTKFAIINFKPDKRTIILYHPWKSQEVLIYFSDENFDFKMVKAFGINDTVKYLGVSLK